METRKSRLGRNVAIKNNCIISENVTLGDNIIIRANVYPWRYHFDRAMPWEGVGYEEWYKMISCGNEN